MDQKINEILDDAKEYGSHQVELVKLEVVEKTATVSAELLTHLILGVIAFILLLFISIAGGFILGEAFNSVALGFLTIAGIYTLIFIILFIWKDSLLKKNFTNYTIKKMLEDAK
tara:strand:+ start:3099 stop:3440 length:342 start_codon:yes stop_codon:yes gene_type:complete